jgi:putative redox protein
MNTIEAQTITDGEFAQTLRVRSHTFKADLTAASGGADSAPGPHDYFDAALASCKATTAIWYAKRKGIPLEKVYTVVESDDTDERAGVYRYRVRMTFHGPLTDEQRTALARAAAACPITKLMTTAEIQIETT